MCRFWENTPPWGGEERPVRKATEDTKIRARAAVRRKAAGMTAEKTEKATNKARVHERMRSRFCETQDDIRAIGTTVAKHTEEHRIGYIMKKEGLKNHNPELDPTAVR